MGIPVLRTKLLAFALSGFMAGYAGVCLAFATERLSAPPPSIRPSRSWSSPWWSSAGWAPSPGPSSGAIYLEGLPAIFGTNPTIQFLTSGLGLMAFILYLPGGLAELLHRLGRPGHPGRADAAPTALG